jgi:2-oxo-4-hydroxy-4-carboxy-5-ureidoimidazoline decarboxylase
MIYTLAEFNQLPTADAITDLMKCCGSRRWADRVTAERPFRSMAELVAASTNVWFELSPTDWLEAFDHHPRIGERKSSAHQSDVEKDWSKSEQSVAAKDDSNEGRLVKLNREYERRFGHIYIVCATGKSLAEILADLQRRLENDPDSEITVAAREQAAITALRLQKLIT